MYHRPDPRNRPTACPSTLTMRRRALAGIWYEVAIHDNGQPGFCDCSVLNWTLSGDGASFVDVYEGRCFTRPFKLPLHGRTSDDPRCARPGGLMRPGRHRLRVRLFFKGASSHAHGASAAPMAHRSASRLLRSRPLACRPH